MSYTERIPLLKDHHTHPSLYTALGNCLDLRDVHDKGRALDLIRAPESGVKVVYGWNNSRYTFSRQELDRLPPVVICNVSLHCFLINAPAKEKLYSVYPDIVTRMEDQEWVEKNLPDIFKFIVNIRPCRPEPVAVFQEYLKRRGIWYAEEMLLPNQATVENHRSLGYLDRTRFWADPELYRSLDSQARDQVYGIKLFTDGALGPGTAALQESYPKGGHGILVRTDEELKAVLEKVADFGKPAAIHAIGDAAVDQVVTVLEEIKRSGGALLPEVRLEHAQFISAASARRARALGIVLSMQPNFSYDSVQYRDRLSAAYCERNNPFRMLIDEAGFTPGKDLIFGSDGMPHGIGYALKMSLFPPLSGQRLTLEEFVDGYCMEDMSNGYIEIQVDEIQKAISSNVVVAS